MKAASLIVCAPLLLLPLRAAAPDAAKPIIDNERVTVWDVTWTKGKPGPIEHHRYDFVTVYYAGGDVKVTTPDGTSKTVTHKTGEVSFGHKGLTERLEGGSDTNAARSMIVELKDHPVPPYPNPAGYALAFPRPGVKKLLDNDRVVTWEYTWKPGIATPVHFHDKDVVLVYLENGALQSTTPDGKSVVNQYSFGQIKFNPGNRVHSELLVSGTQHAIMTELK